ncbi:MAG TPA: sulfatase-like hydrolase/transferase [Sphingomonadaceae bacterium]|nr:sulfatase-like hydrolase/transferase [Sphingomonadaceae bacterium]
MAQRPNILFIMADDLGYADLGCYGRRDYETPVLDRLAGQGIRFTHAYANSAVCTATRVALMTGRYQYRLPIGLEEPLQGRDLGLPPDHPTLPSLLRETGYSTHLIGKWHLGELPKYCPLKSGFDRFWGIRGGGVDYFTHSYNGRRDLWDGEVGIEETGYLTDLLAERAVATIEDEARGERPFFMFLSFTAPHWPWEGPDGQAESERLAATGNPKAIFHWDGGDMATYAAMMQSLDGNVGRVLEALERQGLAEKTIVVFTSDNGGERFSDNFPLTGRKTELLEGGIRIPAIVRWPGLAAPGSTSEQLVMTMDWLPTFLAAAGSAPDQGYPSDGIDIRPAIAGGVLPNRALFWRFLNFGQRAVRSDRWKYLKIAGNEFLFDVVADPMERGNLKERQLDMFEQLRADWQAWDATMLPLDPKADTHGFTGRDLAEYFGIDS